MTTRQYKWALVILVVSGLFGGMLGTWLMPRKAAWAQDRDAGLVTAREFRLVDEEGNVRAELKTEKDKTTLELYDTAGDVRVALDSSNTKAQVLCLDSKEEIRAALSLVDDLPRLTLHTSDQDLGEVILSAEEDGGSLILGGADGKPRAGLIVLDKKAAFALYDSNGEHIVASLKIENRGPELILRDANGTAALVLNAMPEGPNIVLLDASGKVRVGAVVRDDGPAITLKNANGKDQVLIQLSEQGPWFSLTDAWGRPLFFAPQ